MLTMDVHPFVLKPSRFGTAPSALRVVRKQNTREDVQHETKVTS